MSSGAVEQLIVKLQSKEFKFRCPPERKNELVGAIEILDGMVENLREQNRFSSLEHVVILAAVNLICENVALGAARKSKKVMQDFCDRLVVNLAELNTNLNKWLD